MVFFVLVIHTMQQLTNIHNTTIFCLPVPYISYAVCHTAYHFLHLYIDGFLYVQYLYSFIHQYSIWSEPSMQQQFSDSQSHHKNMQTVVKKDIKVQKQIFMLQSNKFSISTMLGTISSHKDPLGWRQGTARENILVFIIQ